MYKYKLKSGYSTDDTFIPGVAFNKEGNVESPVKLESPILELVSDEQPQTAPAQVAPTPTPVTTIPTNEQTANKEQI